MTQPNEVLLATGGDVPDARAAARGRPVVTGRGTG